MRFFNLFFIHKTMKHRSSSNYQLPEERGGLLLNISPWDRRTSGEESPPWEDKLSLYRKLENEITSPGYHGMMLCYASLTTRLEIWFEIEGNDVKKQKLTVSNFLLFFPFIRGEQEWLLNVDLEQWQEQHTFFFWR